MSEFHRMVTYLYLYEGCQKTRNVGYAKIEKRDAQCRVEIHMKNTGLKDCNIPVYFYTQNDTGFPGILLGSINFIRGTGEFKELLDSVNISGTGYDISNIKGIFCPISERKIFLSQWDDDVFDRTLFFPAENSISEEISASPETPVLEGNTSFQPETLDLEAAEAAPDLSYEPVENHSSRWNFIMENFPPVAPFPSENSFEWVQLELKDLRLLPKSYWHLGNNSFLLHGFFNYHHLLLGKKKDTSCCEWTLGVPGVFQNPERVMATIFGFPEFHSTSESNIKTGQFGYWLRLLE